MNEYQKFAQQIKACQDTLASLKAEQEALFKASVEEHLQVLRSTGALRTAQWEVEYVKYKGQVIFRTEFDFAGCSDHHVAEVDYSMVLGNGIMLCHDYDCSWVIKVCPLTPLEKVMQVLSDFQIDLSKVSAYKAETRGVLSAAQREVETYQWFLALVEPCKER